MSGPLIACPESVTSHSQGPDGRCLWCEFKVGRGAVMPDRFGESELSVAYRRAYDPDWGSGRHDVDP